MPRPYAEVKMWRAEHPKRWRSQQNRYYRQFTVNAVSSREGWLESEIRMILAPEHPPDRALSADLGRTVKAIQMKRTKELKNRGSGTGNSNADDDKREPY